jgi:hypothetical protein
MGGKKRMEENVMESEEFVLDDPFYQAEILEKIEDKIGRECEIEDIPFSQIYWSGGFEIYNVDIKLRCMGKTEEDDVVLTATMGRVYYNGDEAVDEETYPADEVVNALLRQYEALYGKQS